MKFITFIRTMWCKTSFSVQINGYFVGPFPHDTPLHKAVQWARYYSLGFWFRGYVYAMAYGSWDKSMDILDGIYYQEITIMVFRLTSAGARWMNITCLWKKARSNPWREASSDGTYVEKHWTRCGHTLLFSKIYYTEQIFTTPEGPRATNLNVYILVYLAWCDLRGLTCSGEIMIVSCCRLGDEDNEEMFLTFNWLLLIIWNHWLYQYFV